MSQALRLAAAHYGRPTRSHTADTHISRTFTWPPAGTSYWPPLGTFSWPRTAMETYYRALANTTGHPAAMAYVRSLTALIESSDRLIVTKVALTAPN